MRSKVLSFAAGVLLSAGLVGCGSSSPREADIYHDPALRPGVVETADGAEQQLLARLDELEDDEAVVELGPRSFTVDPVYHAASGRPCREVRTGAGQSRLVCQTDGGWAFVPQVLPTGPAVEHAAADTVADDGEPR